MTTKEVRKILLYHNRKGFEKELQLLLARIEDYKKICETCITCTPLKLTMPSNRNNSSPVETHVIKAETLETLQSQAKELRRFIDRIDWAIDGLSQVERAVVEARFLNSDNIVKNLYRVAAEIGYSESYCKKANTNALKRICEDLQGVTVKWNF